MNGCSRPDNEIYDIARVPRIRATQWNGVIMVFHLLGSSKLPRGHPFGGGGDYHNYVKTFSKTI